MTGTYVLVLKPGRSALKFVFMRQFCIIAHIILVECSLRKARWSFDALFSKTLLIAAQEMCYPWENIHTPIPARRSTCHRKTPSAQGMLPCGFTFWSVYWEKRCTTAKDLRNIVADIDFHSVTDTVAKTNFMLFYFLEKVTKFHKLWCRECSWKNLLFRRQLYPADRTFMWVAGETRIVSSCLQEKWSRWQWVHQLRQWLWAPQCHLLAAHSTSPHSCLRTLWVNQHPACSQ